LSSYTDLGGGELIEKRCRVRSKRIYFKPGRLPRLVSLAIGAAGSQKRLARATAINQHNIWCYVRGKTTSIRGDILGRILKFLGQHGISNDFHRDISAITDARAYSMKTVGVARKAMLAKHGNYRYLHIKSCEVLRQKYGTDYMRVLSKLGNKALIKKYGHGAHKFITTKGFKSMKARYGANWRLAVGRIAHLTRLKRYGADYLQQRIARTHAKAPLTPQEVELVGALQRKGSGCTSHTIFDNVEFDIVVPSSDEPKVCIEVSTAEPQTSNMYRKIAQLFVRRAVLPNCRFFLVLPAFKRAARQMRYARPDIVKFLLDEGILVFWSNETEHVVEATKAALAGGNMRSFIDEKYRWCLKEFEVRRRHALESALKEVKRTSPDELAFMKAVGLSGKKAIVSNRYGWPIVPDCVNRNSIYEFTRAGGHSALETVSGKLLYLSRTLPGTELNLVLAEHKTWPTRKLLETVCKVTHLGGA